MAAGGITEIDYNKNKLFFNFLAGFSVEEHNNMQVLENSSELEFVKVVNVRQQIVAGTTYYITLEAKDETDKKSNYEAEVWVTLNYSLQLVEFKQLLDAASSSA